jgi:hypothetical protein
MKNNKKKGDAESKNHEKKQRIKKQDPFLIKRKKRSKSKPELGFGIEAHSDESSSELIDESMLVTSPKQVVLELTTEDSNDTDDPGTRLHSLLIMNQDRRNKSVCK